MTLEVRLADGRLKRLPEWMTKQDVCEGMVLSEHPRSGVPALQALRAQLDAWDRRGAMRAGAEDR